MAILYPNWYDQVHTKLDPVYGLVPNAGGKITCMYKDTQNEAPVYNDNDQAISQPVLIDADGRCQLKLSDAIAYDIYIVDSLDAPVKTRYNVQIGSESGNGISSVVAGEGISVDNTDPENPVITNTKPDTFSVKSSSADTVPQTLDNKIVSTDGSLTITENDDPTFDKQVDLSVTDQFPEAPVDGKIYGRKDADWVETRTKASIDSTDIASVTRATADEISTWTFTRTDGSKIELEATSSVNTQTGFLRYDGATAVNVATRTINVGAGDGYVVDYYTDQDNPSLKKLIWEAQNFVLPAGTFHQVYVSVGSQNPDGTYVGVVACTSDTYMTSAQLRDNIALSKAVIQPPASLDVINDAIPSKAQSAALYDYIDVLGFLKTGGLISEGTLPFNFDVEAFTLTRPYINADADLKDPTPFPVGAETDVSFFYVIRDGAGGQTIETPAVDLIDYLAWDDNTGSTSVVPANRFTVQRLYYSVINSVYFVLYGQKLYTTYTGAVQGSSADAFFLPSFLDNKDTVYMGAFVTKGSSAGLEVDGSSIILPSGLIPAVGTGGGSGGGAVTIHNGLDGLQGGDAGSDEFYHLDATDYNAGIVTQAMDRATADLGSPSANSWAKIATVTFTGTSGSLEIPFIMEGPMGGVDYAKAIAKVVYDNGSIYANMVEGECNVDGSPLWDASEDSAIRYKDLGSGVVDIYAYYSHTYNIGQDKLGWAKPQLVESATVVEYDGATWTTSDPSTSKFYLINWISGTTQKFYARDIDVSGGLVVDGTISEGGTSLASKYAGIAGVAGAFDVGTDLDVDGNVTLGTSTSNTVDVAGMLTVGDDLEVDTIIGNTDSNIVKIGSGAGKLEFSPAGSGTSGIRLQDLSGTPGGTGNLFRIQDSGGTVRLTVLQNGDVDVAGSLDVAGSVDLAGAYAQTTDPLVAGRLWNNSGVATFSDG
jgi:hypothetical protein